MPSALTHLARYRGPPLHCMSGCECKPDAERKRDSAQPQERAQPSIDQSKEVPMNDSKSTVRYLGCRSLPDGGRGFDFSFAHGSAKPTMITIEAPIAFFQGPDRIAIQEALGICYETLKFRIQTDPVSPPDHFNLTSADVAQHRKIAKPPGSRRRGDES